MKSYILSIDQGTSGTKAIIFDKDANVITKATETLKSYYPQPGFVEQDPQEIFQNVLDATKNCLNQFKKDHESEIAEISCIGISNQRETLVLWDKEGNPIHNAIVWQCKRSVSICEELIEAGLDPEIRQRTGLLIDPYFSATKVIWLYRNEPKVKSMIDAGEAYFGTVDSWLLYKMTGGKEYATDFTNASRTLFYNLDELRWDDVLLEKFGLTGLNLPEVKSSSSLFGKTDLDGLLPTSIPVSGMIGDSHAAAFGEGCYEPGTAKATMGTGSSILMNCGDGRITSKEGMVSTVCWSVGERVDHALEGVIVSCGATLEWLRQQLGVYEENHQLDEIATSVPDNQGVYLIPAFSGLGAPHWQMERKASIHGLTFQSDKAHVVRAGLESVAWQIKDVISAMEKEMGKPLKKLNVDGGLTKSKFLMQLLADILETSVVNIGIADVSALGAALIAGLGNGVWNGIDSLPELTDHLGYTPNENPHVKEEYNHWKALIND